nr:putative TctA citrate transporter [uncultured bacterium]
MELLEHLALGFSVAFTLQNLMYAFIGCLLGTLIGVLPGVGPVATIAMLLPTTYALPPVAALIMLAGIYYGAQYGGSTTAILVNLPGEASSVVTVIDGHQMARKGRGGPALAAAAIGSFIAGCFGTLVLAGFAVPLTEVAFKFGPAEYFSLMVLGLIGAVVLASGSLIKAVGMIVLGLLLGLVGTDVNSGVARYSFDIPELTDGIGFIAIAMGVFGYGEIIANLSHAQGKRGGVRRQAAEPVPVQGRLEADDAVHRARHAAGFGAGHFAGWRRRAVGVCGLHDREENQAQVRRSAVRQGQHPRRGGAGIGQQRRLANLLHPAADAGHSAQRRDGADGGRHDHPQHPARPAGDDQQPRPVLGPDPSMWIGNAMLVILNLPLIACGSAADGALPLAVPAIVLSAPSACTPPQHTWTLDDGWFGSRLISTAVMDRPAALG